MDQAMEILLNEILTEQRACRADILEVKTTIAGQAGERRATRTIAAITSAVVSIALTILGWFVSQK